jgi:hypothetical protein
MGMAGGKENSKGNPAESIQVESVANSKPVSPRSDFRAKASSCGPAYVISVAVLVSLGVMAESQRLEAELVDGRLCAVARQAN